jgi:tRNA(His) guanylyltransferase
MIDTLGDRMKDFYEDRYRINLPRRTYTIIRIDGKAFHTYTKGLKRPFDAGLIEDMNETTAYLCKNIQGAKLGYVQSDEISIIVTDFDELGTHAWFDNNMQKMASIAASMATAKFNQLRMARFCRNEGTEPKYREESYVSESQIKEFKLAMFDARVFQIPFIDEVVNYLIWRQQDATRNSISSVAQSLYSHKELHNKSTDDMQEMIFQKGINWNDYSYREKRGTVIARVEIQTLAKDFKFADDGKTHVIDPSQIITRKKWQTVETPVFTQDKEFITSMLPGK